MTLSASISLKTPFPGRKPKDSSHLDQFRVDYCPEYIRINYIQYIRFHGWTEQEQQGMFGVFLIPPNTVYNSK